MTAPETVSFWSGTKADVYAKTTMNIEAETDVNFFALTDIVTNVAGTSLFQSFDQSVRGAGGQYLFHLLCRFCSRCVRQFSDLRCR